MKKILILLFLLVYVSSVYAVCTPQSGYVCTTGNTECGGIKVEDICYDCGGGSDSICPEDFGATCLEYDFDCAPSSCASCGDLPDTEEGCIGHVCDDGSCYLDLGLVFDTCSSCTGDEECGGYDVQTDCTTNPCDISGGCDWDGSDCILKDTDGDGMPDWWEDDPEHDCIDSTVDDATEDPDDDRLNNLEEYEYGTNPCEDDTDDDDFDDGDEIEEGTDPLDDEDYPEECAPDYFYDGECDLPCENIICGCECLGSDCNTQGPILYGADCGGSATVEGCAWICNTATEKFEPSKPECLSDPDFVAIKPSDEDCGAVTQQKTPFPIYDHFNLLATVLILVIFYALKKR